MPGAVLSSQHLLLHFTESLSNCLSVKRQSRNMNPGILAVEHALKYYANLTASE